MAKQAFKPVVYVSRAKALTVWVEVKEGEAKRNITFVSNGLVGVHTALTEEESSAMEKNPHFNKEFRRIAEGEEIKGGMVGNIVRGVRSALAQAMQPEPIDAKVEQVIAESNQARKRNE